MASDARRSRHELAGCFNAMAAHRLLVADRVAAGGERAVLHLPQGPSLVAPSRDGDIS